MKIKIEKDNIKCTPGFEANRINYNFGKNLDKELQKNVKEKLKGCFKAFTNMDNASAPDDFNVTTDSKKENADLFGFIQDASRAILPCVIKATSAQKGSRNQSFDLVIYAKATDIETIKETIKKAFLEI